MFLQAPREFGEGTQSKYHGEEIYPCPHDPHASTLKKLKGTLASHPPVVHAARFAKPSTIATFESEAGLSLCTSTLVSVLVKQWLESGQREAEA